MGVLCPCRASAVGKETPYLVSCCFRGRGGGRPLSLDRDEANLSPPRFYDLDNHPPGPGRRLPGAGRRRRLLGPFGSALDCEEGGETHQTEPPPGGGDGAVAQPPERGKESRYPRHPF